MTTTSLEAAVTEIAMRATAKVCEGMHPTRLEAVAIPLAEALVDVLCAGDSEENKDDPQMYFVEVPNYIVFELWNKILDEVEKEIPAANRIEVAGMCTRSDRRELFSEGWKKTIQKPHPRKKGVSHDRP